MFRGRDEEKQHLVARPVFIFIYLEPPVAGARQICLARPGMVGAVEMYVLGFSFVIHIVLFHYKN